MPQNTIDPLTTVGSLVRERPARSRIFEELKLDYCCGGRLPLVEACEKRGLDAQDVLGRLLEADRNAADHPNGLVDAGAMGLSELADHIEESHHAYLKRELPRLGAMVNKVAAVHGEHYPWMVEIARLFANFAVELEAHMHKEEHILFPLVRNLDRHMPCASCAPMNLAAPIRAMEHEHDAAGDALQRMSELSNGYTPPEGACNTFRAMLDALAQLERDMHQHVHKENNVLFPRALAVEASRRSKSG